ncbi:hypothetical protein SAMN05216241_101223 [Limimonas halophila]|uniref:Uncharacterized protein n=1 Tax=Limimonas halophila TaxID=1082479 RepID=A0A1G7LFB8_9PROT|nr:hypothetical protein [Limimonas halophila]SDF48024.1 hypothetical protein SAMN05216241_101223 [Limimonas halophila]
MTDNNGGYQGDGENQSNLSHDNDLLTWDQISSGIGYLSTAIAVIIPIATLLLYFLAYWDEYWFFHEAGVPSEFVNISFTEIVSFASHTLIFIALVSWFLLVTSGCRFYSHIKSPTFWFASLVFSVFLIISLLAFALTIDIARNWMVQNPVRTILILIVFVGLISFLSPALVKRSVGEDPTLGKTYLKVLGILIVFTVGLYILQFSSAQSALELKFLGLNPTVSSENKCHVFLDTYKGKGIFYNVEENAPTIKSFEQTTLVRVDTIENCDKG